MSQSSVPSACATLMNVRCHADGGGIWVGGAVLDRERRERGETREKRARRCHAERSEASPGGGADSKSAPGAGKACRGRLGWGGLAQPACFEQAFPSQTPQFIRRRPPGLASPALTPFVSFAIRQPPPPPGPICQRIKTDKRIVMPERIRSRYRGLSVYPVPHPLTARFPPTAPGRSGGTGPCRRRGRWARGRAAAASTRPLPPNPTSSAPSASRRS